MGEHEPWDGEDERSRFECLHGFVPCGDIHGYQCNGDDGGDGGYLKVGPVDYCGTYSGCY